MIFTNIAEYKDGWQLAWKLLNERPFEANISHREMPSHADHIAYVMHHPYRLWLVIEMDGVPVGVIALTMRNEIAIAILKEHQRKGYARKAIQEIKRLVPPLPAEEGVRDGYYIANVAPGNMPSHALFTGMGAKLVQVTYRFGG